MDDEGRSQLKRKRIENVEEDVDENDQVGPINTQPHTRNIFEATNLSGNAQAILGNVHGLDGQFFRHFNRADSRKPLLKALYFEGMRSRKEQVGAQAGSPRFYWVTGRPGSGKSTLMKHICDSKKTLELLQKGGQNWTTLDFFFDFRTGYDVANTIEGMIRSLLYQLVKRVPDAGQHVDSTLYTSGMRSNSLQGCIDNFCDALKLSPTRICAFIDGLDEFEGPSSHLLEIIHGLEDRANLKICLASRPYLIFENGLSRYSHIAMQDHNDQSIRLYAEAQWANSRLCAQASLPRILSEEIRRRANGVFLWARLATDELLENFLVGMSVEALRQKLEHMPKEVEGMYLRILECLPVILKAEAALLLYMIISSGEGHISIRKLYVALEASIKKIDGDIAILPIEVDVDNSNRIQAALGDFLDISQRPYKVAPLIIFENSTLECQRGISSHVAFSHETHRSFLMTSSRLRENLPPEYPMAHKPSFWLDLYLDELMVAARYRPEQSSGISILVTSYIRATEQGFADKDGRRALWQVKYEEELKVVLSLWAHWNPLLPYALQSVLWQCRLDFNDSGYRMADLQQILLSPFFALQSAICMFHAFDATVRDDFSGFTRPTDFEQHQSSYLFLWESLISQTETTGIDMAMAIAHELDEYLTRIVSQRVFERRDHFAKTVRCGLD